MEVLFNLLVSQTLLLQSQYNAYSKRALAHLFGSENDDNPLFLAIS